MHRRTFLHAAAVATGALAIGACAQALPAIGKDAGNEIELQVMPAGKFYPSDGRELPVDGWRIDAALAAELIERFQKRRVRTVIDYEHQTLNRENNGQPPAGSRTSSGARAARARTAACGQRSSSRPGPRRPSRRASTSTSAPSSCSTAPRATCSSC
jgi:hypothetical protein